MTAKTLLATACALLALSGCQSVPLNTKATATPPDDGVGLMAPLVERIENLTATGYAVISVQNHRNAGQQRLLAMRAAKLDAYRMLTEQVYGLQLDANSTVADMVVTSDSFRSKVQGVIYGATLVSITPVGEDTYETTLALDKSVVQQLRRLYANMQAQRAR